MAVLTITIYLYQWEQSPKVKDGGYFGNTPFVISFVELINENLFEMGAAEEYLFKR